jgi:hypothetical protein
MPAVTLYWSKNAIAAIGPSGQSSFTGAREAAECDSNSNNTEGTNSIVSGTIRNSGRGGAAFGFKRSYWGFDFTGYTAGDITNLKFNFKPSIGSTGTLSNRLAQFNGFGTEVGSNFTVDDWWDEIADPLVPYSNAFNSPDSTTVQAITLNSTAITDAGTDGFLKLVLMNNGDYNNLNVAVDNNNITNWNIGSNTTGNIYLSFDYAGPGYPNIVNAIAAANIEKISAIASSTIDKVNGVS